VPRELFETVEKMAMLTAPTEPFDVPRWIDDAKVHPDHHLQVARALYSVPTLYLHVRVRADKTTVRIYFGTELIKMHPRQPPGGRSTDGNDYPVGKAAHAMRSVDAVLAKAKDKGTHVGEYVERLLAGPLPWARMRQGYVLIGLCDKYGNGRVEAICQSALAFGVVDVGRVTRMVKAAAKPTVPAQAKRQGNLVQLRLPRFARPEQQFETRSVAKKEEGKPRCPAPTLSSALVNENSRHATAECNIDEVHHRLEPLARRVVRRRRNPPERASIFVVHVVV